MGMAVNLLVSELIMAVPAVIAPLASKEKPNRVLGFHKLKISSVLMIILYTFLMQPLTTLLNAISMLFVDNAVTSISSEVMNLPFMADLFMMALFGPFCEEFLFPRRSIQRLSEKRERNGSGSSVFSAFRADAYEF